MTIVDLRGRSWGPGAVGLGWGPGKGGRRSSGGMMGTSTDFTDGRGTEEAVDICVREDVCEIVRLSWRVINGEE